MNPYLRSFLTAFIVVSASALPARAETGPVEVSFPSTDGLEITADLYSPHADAGTPFILLFHQAGWSRGEYREIAPKLGELGFNCLAVDQRSGGEVNGVANETHPRAEEQGLATEYTDALADLEASVAWAREKHAKGELLIWGSSYSAALVLKLAGDQPEEIEGVLAFAPGEYFESAGRPKDWITRSASKIADPVFITSARDEKPKWWGIWESIGSQEKSHYLPETAGNHGSRALWERFEDSPGYWTSLRAFLEPFHNGGR